MSAFEVRKLRAEIARLKQLVKSPEEIEVLRLADKWNKPGNEKSTAPHLRKAIDIKNGFKREDKVSIFM